MGILRGACLGGRYQEPDPEITRVEIEPIEVVPGLWCRKMSSTIGCINTAEVGTPGRYGGMDWVRVNWLFQYSGIQQQVWDNLAAFPEWFQEQMQEQRR